MIVIDNYVRILKEALSAFF